MTRILNLPNQPSILRHPRDGYFFQSALESRYRYDTFGRPVDGWADGVREKMTTSLQRSSDAWGEWIEDAKSNNKGTFIKEHINWMIRPAVESSFLYDDIVNPTCLPNVFLLHKTRPTFLIRHPALTVPSLIRTALDNEGIEELLTESSERNMQWETTYHWHITLYKFLLASPIYPSPSHDPNITYPIIIDAADLSNPVFVKKYAAVIGLDPRLVQFEWGVTDEKGMGRVEIRMKDTLLKSKDVLAAKLGAVEDLDLCTIKAEWKREFGEVLGERVTGLVERAMADYEWLWERRMRV
jgi:hypothetical protein